MYFTQSIEKRMFIRKVFKTLRLIGRCMLSYRNAPHAQNSGGRGKFSVSCDTEQGEQGQLSFTVKPDPYVGLAPSRGRGSGRLRCRPAAVRHERRASSAIWERRKTSAAAAAFLAGLFRRGIKPRPFKEDRCFSPAPSKMNSDLLLFLPQQSLHQADWVLLLAFLAT